MYHIFRHRLYANFLYALRLSLILCFFANFSLSRENLNVDYSGIATNDAEKMGFGNALGSTHSESCPCRSSIYTSDDKINDPNDYVLDLKKSETPVSKK